MHSRECYYFTGRDLKTALRFNPFLRAIGGHSVVPHGDLVHGPVQLRFITQVRDPVSRAASQYRYWVNRLKLDPAQPAYLQHPASQNFQVKKIAGCEDLDLAKENISKHFLLAGTVDKFDEFLVLLAKKLGMPSALFTYRKQNVDANPQRLEIPDSFYGQLRERNQLDQQLYDWIDTGLFAQYLAEYAGDFMADLEDFRNLQTIASRPIIKPLIDSIYRNSYLKPVSGLIRVRSGLPFSGSYSTE